MVSGSLVVVLAEEHVTLGAGNALTLPGAPTDASPAGRADGRFTR